MELIILPIAGLFSALVLKFLGYFPGILGGTSLLLPGTFFGLALIWKIQSSPSAKAMVVLRSSRARSFSFLIFSTIIYWFTYLAAALITIPVNNATGNPMPQYFGPFTYTLSFQATLVGGFVGGCLGAFLLLLAFKMLLDANLKFILFLSIYGGLLGILGLEMGSSVLPFIWQIGVAFGLGIALKYSVPMQ